MSSMDPTQSSLGLWAFLFTIVAIALWVDKTSLGRSIPGAIIALVLGAILSNVNILPSTSGVYDVATGMFVGLAIPLLLLTGNLRRIWKETGRLFGVFLLAVSATVAGTITAYFLIPIEPPFAQQLAGSLAAGYTGGSVNFVAVSNALGLSGSSFVATAAADHLIGNLYLMLLMILPAIAIVRKWYPDVSGTASQLPVAPSAETAQRLNPVAIICALAMSFSINWIGTVTGEATGVKYMPILTITAITVALATCLPRQVERLEGAYTVGMILMYVFFAAIGANLDMTVLWKSGPTILLFATIIVLMHLVVLLTAARLFRFSLAEIVVSSAATVGGPPVAAAIASAKGWPHLVTPGLLVGILGYVLGNFIGIALAQLLT
jgi:uncharacterized membrane protein